LNPIVVVPVLITRIPCAQEDVADWRQYLSGHFTRLNKGVQWADPGDIGWLGMEAAWGIAPPGPDEVCVPYQPAPAVNWPADDREPEPGRWHIGGAASINFTDVPGVQDDAAAIHALLAESSADFRAAYQAVVGQRTMQRRSVMVDSARVLNASNVTAVTNLEPGDIIGLEVPSKACPSDKALFGSKWWIAKFLRYYPEEDMQRLSMEALRRGHPIDAGATYDSIDWKGQYFGESIDIEVRTPRHTIFFNSST
jgi:hypothetical protein